ncbi:hybrid sensor histidine kinase/response regulator [Rhodopirellula europaea]|nr:PAS domain S-box protein [Rhodopirellula europaea]
MRVKMVEDRSTILIAESNVERREHLVQVLGRRHNLAAVEDGKSAWAQLTQGSFDAVVAGFDLREVSGVNLLAQTRAHAELRGVPFVLVVGEATPIDPTTWQHVFEFERSDIQCCPINEHELLARVDSIIRRARVKNESADMLRRQKSRLQMALLASRMVAVEWDISADTVLYSENAIEIFGIKSLSDHATGRTARELVHPDDVDTVEKTIQSTLQGSREFHTQFRIIRPDNGEIVWIEERGYVAADASGKPSKLVAVAVDITARRNAEQAIQEREHYLQAIFDTTPECIKVVRSDGTLTQMNAAGLKMIEASPSTSVAGSSVYGLIAPEFLDSFREFNQRVCDGHSGVMEFDIIGLQGSRRHMETHAVPLSLTNGETVQLAVTRDITERKRSEATLRENERRFRALTQATSDIVFRMNADWSEMGMLEGRTFIDSTTEPSRSWLDHYIHPDDQIEVRKAIQDSVEKRSLYELEHRVIRIDGTLGWIHSRAVPIFDDAGNVVEWFGAGTDVTEKKQIEEYQHRATQTLLTVIEQSPLGIYLVDGDFKIAQVSLGAGPAFQNVQPVIGRDFEEVMHTIWPSGFANEAVRIFRQTLASGEPYISPGLTEKRKDLGETESYEWQVNRITLADGSYGLVCYFFDSTRLQQAADALRESEVRFRMLADNMSQLAWTCCNLGECNWYNQRWYEYTGCTFEEMQAWGWRKVHHPDHVDRVVDRIQRAAAAGEVWEDTFPLRGKDGQYRWFLSRAVPIRDEQGSIVRWFGTNTDINELRETQQLLHDADRRKDEFLAMLAHELRNPLAPIRSGLDLLALADDDEHRDVVRVMQEQVTHVVRLVDDLLDVSRIMRGKVELRKERIEFQSTVQKAIDAVQDTIASHGHSLTTTLPEETIWLEADPIRIVQVLENLLSNATKYMDGSGTIELSACVKNDSLLIQIQDEGIGIDQEFLPKVFDLFAQSDRSLDRSKGGLGIGLTLVKQLLEMHGGNIHAESDGLGKGTSFHIELPIASSTVPRQDAPLKRQSDGQARRIAVIDDNRGAVLLLSKLFEKLGAHEVHTANDGEAALKLIRKVHPEIVLLDIGLPGLNGYEVASAIREESRFDDILMVALTGYGQDQDRLKSEAAGFDEHLVKPPSIDQMRFVLAHPKLKHSP